MLKYAVVGAGWISQEAFLPGVGQSTNSRVAAIVTGDADKAPLHQGPQGVGTVNTADRFEIGPHDRLAVRDNRQSLQQSSAQLRLAGRLP